MRPTTRPASARPASARPASARLASARPASTRLASALLAGALLTGGLLACAGDERSPLPYYGVAAAPGAGGSGSAGSGASGTSGQAGTSGQVTPPGGPVVLNEIDPSGEPSDWVELVNRGEQPVDLSGWSVVQGDGAAPLDDGDRLRLPAGTTLAAGSYLRVFTRAPDSPGPGDFGLGKDSAETVSLLDAADALVDTTTLDASADAPLAAGSSWARLPDGEGAFGRATSTPDAANAP